MQGSHPEPPPECPAHVDRGVDSRNQMPFAPEETPSASQHAPLSTHRVTSSIPKGDFTPPHQKDASPQAKEWLYPSEQQFYNAMKRKGWDPQEGDMRAIVSIHNTVNERSWQEVMKWEKMHECECPEGPKLFKFLGRPNDPSPRSLVRQYLFGYSAPFDRHDWTVDRCGRQVRYVLDFYRGHSHLQLAYHIDCRPALDSWQAALDRFRMAVKEFAG